MIPGLELPAGVLALGAIVGLTYGLLAVGLVLVHRSSGIVNFAHGEMGIFGAAVVAAAVQRWGWPYYVAMAAGIVSASAIAVTTDVTVVRRLRRAPPVLSVIATLGVGQVLVVLSGLVSPGASGSFRFPEPPGMPTFDIGSLRVTPAHSAMLLMAPVVVATVTLFLRRSRQGLHIRAAAVNADAARMAGISPVRASRTTWAVAGAVSAFTAILVVPTRGYVGADSFGPELLLRGLACAVVGRMTSLPLALATGVGLGVVEQIVLWNSTDRGVVDLAVFVLIVAALAIRRATAGRGGAQPSWTALGRRELPSAWRQVRAVRLMGPAFAAVLLAVALVLPVLISSSNATTMSTVFAFAIVGLSVVVLTGIGGQLTLGQFGVAGVGAAASIHVATTVEIWPLAILAAGGAGAVTLVLIGLPSLRFGGLMFTATTLAFGVLAPAWLLTRPWLLADGRNPGRPVVMGNTLDTGTEYSMFVLVILLIAVAITWSVHRSALGRSLRAIRDNELNARAFGVRATFVRAQALAISGFLAGIGGAAFGHLLPRLSASAFSVRANIDVVAVAVVGGITTIVGPVLGALYIVAVPAFLPLDSAGLAATQLGWLALVMQYPGGIASAADGAHRRIAGALVSRARHRAKGVVAQPASRAGAGLDPQQVRLAGESAPRCTTSNNGPALPLLRVVGLGKRYGGIVAVDDVSFDVARGETVGLIGPNGAGKTTVFEMISGFTRPDHGRILFEGDEINRVAPEERARRGLVRSFQDAAMFPTMTVEQCMMVSLERLHPTSAVRALTSDGRVERRRRERVSDVIAMMGLGEHRDRRVSELSTGVRRITELACLVALEPTVLLLDEPAGGVAQREVEALGVLLADVRSQLGMTLLVIEHDLSLVMSLSDRVVAMDLGRVVADDAPGVVRHDPHVVASYLGAERVTIDRSRQPDVISKPIPSPTV